MSRSRLADRWKNRVSRETFDQLDIYVSLLEHWQKRINLIGHSTVGEIWHRHVDDSLQLLDGCLKSGQWVDLGSGAGFPGLVIAIALANDKENHVTMIESNHKKAAFLRTVLRETGVTGTVLCERIEDVGASWSREIDYVSARALAPLTQLCGLALPFFGRKTCGFFHKGKEFVMEVEKAALCWHFDLIEHSSALSQDGSVILELRNLSPIDNAPLAK